MDIPVNLVLQRRWKKWAYVLAALVFLTAILVLMGWEVNSRALKSIWPDAVAMNPLTAVCFLLVILSYVCITQAAAGSHWLFTARLLALLVIAAGSIKLINGLISADINIDQFLFAGMIEREKVPNRMAYNTALGMIVTGVVLIAMSIGKKQSIHLAQILSGFLSLLGIIVLLGYIYQAEVFYGFFAFTPMAVITGFLFFLLGLLFLLYTSGSGYMLLFTTNLSGSTMARILVPTAVLIPALFGLLRLWGYWNGIYDTEFGVVLHVVIIILLFLSLVIYNAIILNRRDFANRRVQKSLLDSEAQIRAIFDNAPDAVIVMNEKGIVEKWNPQATSLFGWTTEEAIGQPLDKLIIPEELRDSHRRGMQRYLNTGKSEIFGTTVDLWAITKDDSKRDVSLRISPLQADGRQLFIGFIRDIGERKEMEDKLKSFNKELGLQVEQKTAELKDIFERVTDGFVAMDKQFHFTYVNKTAAELLRRDPETLLGKSALKEFPEIGDSVMHHALIRAMNQQEHVKVTDYHAALDLWQESNIYPSENGLSIFIKDITAQRKKEQEIAEARGIADKLIDSLPGVFYFYDEHGRFIRWNRQLEEVTGYTADEIAQMHPVQLFPMEERAYITGRIAQVFEQGENDAEASFLSKDGKKTPYYFKAVLMEYKGVPCLLGSGIDITEIKAAEERIKESYHSIRQLTGYLQNIREQERLHISREIHDELGQLLTVMKMDISWLNKKLTDSPSQIQTKIADLLAVIDKTVTTVRRIASELRPSLLDNLGLVAAIEWHLEEFKKRSGLQVDATLPGRELSLPDSQKIALFRVLQESLTNVGRHADASEVNISMEIKNNLLVLQIADNGKGFDANQKERKTLGLLGMQERIADIGGYYQIHSRPGAGTRVTVTVAVKDHE